MSRTVIARRYAHALFELAREKGELDRIRQELDVAEKPSNGFLNCRSGS